MYSFLPSKISFFCPICVNESGVIKTNYKKYNFNKESETVEEVGVYKHNMHCNECNNKRIITSFIPIDKLTPNYCIPDITKNPQIENGTYFTLLLSAAETQGGISAAFIETNDLINTARFIKDRFFFGNKLSKEFYSSALLFISQIAWIPR